MAITFIPVLDKDASTSKDAILRAHYTNSWSDYPNGAYGNWTCEDT